MAQKYKNVGGIEASDALATLTDGDGAYMDYDTSGGSAHFGAKGGAGSNRGVLIRTLLAGVAIAALTFAPSGAAAFSGNVAVGAASVANAIGWAGMAQVAASGSAALSLLDTSTTAQQWDLVIDAKNFEVYDVQAAVHAIVVTKATGATAFFGSVTAPVVIGGGPSNPVPLSAGGTNVVTNIAIGASALAANTTGNFNTAVGYVALALNTTGVQNTALGRAALGAVTTGSHNTAMGMNALFVATGDGNTAIGNSALQSLTAGSNNTAVGYLTLLLAVAQSGNVGIGYSAGKYELGSNAFYVDNQDRTNTAGDKAGALLYGTFNSTPASQTLAINAKTTVLKMNIATSESPLSGGTGVAGQITWDSGFVYICTATNTWKRAALTGGY